MICNESIFSFLSQTLSLYRLEKNHVIFWVKIGESHHHAHHSHHSHHHGGSAVATAQHAHNSHGVAAVVSNKNNRRKVSLPYNPCPTSHW